MASISLTLGRGLTKRAKKFPSYHALKDWSQQEESFWLKLIGNTSGKLLSDKAPIAQIVLQHQKIQAEFQSNNFDRQWINKIAAGIHFVSNSPEGHFFAKTDWKRLEYLQNVMSALSGKVPASSLSPSLRKLIADEISGWSTKFQKRYKDNAAELLTEVVSSETQYFNLIDDRIGRLESLMRKKEDVSVKRDETSRQQVETLLKDIETQAKSIHVNLKNDGVEVLKNMDAAFKQTQDNCVHKEAALETNIEKVTKKLSNFDEKIAKANSEFDDVLVALRAKLQLEEGANYWDEKAKGHDKVKLYMSIALAIYAIATVFCVYLLGLSVLSDNSPLSNALTNTVSPRSIFLLGMIGVVYTVVFWGGRILTRITLGHIHLANDAKERGVVMQTYLALQSDSVVTPEERQIMLSTVFRPSTDGVVRDDAAPMNTLRLPWSKD